MSLTPSRAARHPGCACLTFLLGLLLACGPAHAADLLAALRGDWAAAGADAMTMTWSGTGDGFSVRWTAPGGKEARETSFKPSARPGVLVGDGGGGWSMFGRDTAVDPLVNGTLRWARLTTDTVYLYSIAVDDHGAYVIERYGCRPAGDRLEVAFQRMAPVDQVEERKVSLNRVAR